MVHASSNRSTCFYAYNEVYGNTNEAVYAKAGVFFEIEDNKTIPYLNNNYNDTNLLPVMSHEDCGSNG